MLCLALPAQNQFYFRLDAIDCFEHYDSSVDVDSFRTGFPYARRQINACNFRSATLLHVADQSVPQT